MKLFEKYSFDDDVLVIIVTTIASILISLTSFFGSDNNISFLAVPVVVLISVRFLSVGTTEFLNAGKSMAAIGIITLIAILSTFI